MSPPSIGVDSGCKDGLVEIKVANLLRTRKPTVRLFPVPCQVCTIPDACSDGVALPHS
ncbi:hypothetical protein PISMIDRAFT_688646, partial [Pisolithus microcarpus 441]